MRSGCMKCQIQEQTLLCAKPGDRLIVAEINGGRKANMRLRAMGIKKGDQIEVVNIFGGQMVIAVDYTRLAICRGLAKKIKVEPVSER